MVHQEHLPIGTIAVAMPRKRWFACSGSGSKTGHGWKRKRDDNDGCRRAIAIHQSQMVPSPLYCCRFWCSPTICWLDDFRVRFGLLKQLTAIDFSNNLSTSTIPSEVGLMTQLRNLYLNKNKLTGTVPSSLCSLPSLSGFIYIDCGENHVCFRVLLGLWY